MKQIAFTAILILMFCLAALAQVNENLCPQIKLIAPSNVLQPFEPAVFAVKVGEGIAEKDLTYEWTFSRGKIVRGQGSSQVEIVTTPEDEGTNFTYTVKIAGLTKNCPDTKSDIHAVAAIVIGDPLDDFGKRALDERRARLDSFFIGLANNPNSEGVIILTFDKSDSRTYKKSLLKNINRHVAFRKFDLARISFAVSEHNSEERTMLWIIPAGAEFPEFIRDNYQIIKAEELEGKIKKLFPAK